MSYIKSRLLFWLLLIIALNVFSLVLMHLKGVFEAATAPALLQIVVGFILQLPIVFIAAVLDCAVLASSSRLPYTQVWRFSMRFFLLYVFLFLYIASTVIYLGVGVFVSSEVIKIAILDFDQIQPILLTTALVPVVVLAVVVLLFFIPFKYKLCTSKTYVLPVFLLWFFVFLLAALFFLAKLSDDREFSVAVFKNTFPSTFLVGEVFDYFNRFNGVVEELDVKQLAPQISMKAYRESAGQFIDKPPVILIMLESISHNHLGFTGYKRADITPHLDELFSQSVFFDRTYTPSNHSNLAQGAILSSQYPLRRIRIETFKDVNYEKPMLFDILHEFGYETALYSAQDENWLGMRRFIESKNAKIDHFKHALDFSGYYKFYDKKIDDADLITEVSRYLTQIRAPEKPQMLYLNLQRTHYDYRLKPGVAAHYAGAGEQVTGMFFDYGEHQVEKAQLQYDNALHYVDAQLGRLFNQLKALDMYDEALIIVTADHGEAFYENGYATHATSMYDPQIRSFLSLKLPKQKVGVYRKDAISSVDIMPMALEALGLPNHPAFQGYQLLEKSRTDNQPIFATGQSVVRAEAVIQWPWKYFVSEKEGAVLINLASDPLEKVNLLLDEKPVVEKLQSWRQQYRNNQLQYYRHSHQDVRDDYYVPKYDFTPKALD